MSKAAMNLQDSFLNQVRRENSEVRVLLANGTLLRGVVKGFDNFTLILNNRNGQHLVYKHAIAQIVTHRPHVKPEDTAHDLSDAAHQVDPADSGENVETTQKEKPVVPSERPRRERQRREHHEGREHREGREPRDKNKVDQSRQKKEGFNTIDLSGVKLGEK